MPGSVGPSPDDYEVVVTETVVRDSACGLNSHEIETLNGLIADLERRNEDGWELISAHRSVLVPGDTQHDAPGTPIRGRIIRHELAFRRASPPRRRWEYGIDALSDPDRLDPGQVMADRFLQGWEMVGASCFTFEAARPASTTRTSSTAPRTRSSSGSALRSARRSAPRRRRPTRRTTEGD